MNRPHIGGAVVMKTSFWSAAWVRGILCLGAIAGVAAMIMHSDKTSGMRWARLCPTRGQCLNWAVL